MTTVCERRHMHRVSNLMGRWSLVNGASEGRSMKRERRRKTSRRRGSSIPRPERSDWQNTNHGGSQVRRRRHKKRDIEFSSRRIPASITYLTLYQSQLSSLGSSSMSEWSRLHESAVTKAKAKMHNPCRHCT